MMARPPIAAAVVGRDGFALDDGTTGEIPPSFVGDPVRLLRVLSDTCTLDATVLWDEHEWPDHVGDLQQRLEADGWYFASFREDYTTFTKLYNGNIQQITIGLLPNISGYMLFDAKTDPWPVIVQRLAQYRKLTGVAWRGRPGINGVQALRNLYQSKKPGAQPRWFYQKGPGSPGFPRMWPAGDLMFKREPSAVENGAMPYVHRLDVNGQYLAAANTVHLAWGELERSTDQRFDATRGGYWRIRYADICNWPAPLPPIVSRRRIADDGTLWVTTPILELMYERHCFPHIFESWTAPGKRWLVPWVERFRSARLGMLGDISDPHIAAAVKSTANEAIGFTNRKGGRVQRPDIQHTVIDKARCNTLRRLVAVFESCGEVPIRIDYDSVWYTEEGAKALRPVDSTGKGDVHPTMLGKFRHIKTSQWHERDWEKGKRA